MSIIETTFPHVYIHFENDNNLTKDGVSKYLNYWNFRQCQKTNFSCTLDTSAIKDRDALGNKYFHKLGIKCTSEKSGTEEDLYTYYDNVPKEPNNGLVTGIKDQIDNMGPTEQANLYDMVYYDSDDKVMCKKILCELRNDDHETRKDVAYVSVSEFNDLIETEKCYDLYGSDEDEAAEGFKNLQEVSSKLPSDCAITGYYTLLSILGLYFIYNCTINKKS